MELNWVKMKKFMFRSFVTYHCVTIFYQCGCVFYLLLIRWCSPLLGELINKIFYMPTIYDLLFSVLIRSSVWINYSIPITNFIKLYIIFLFQFNLIYLHFSVGYFYVRYSVYILISEYIKIQIIYLKINKLDMCIIFNNKYKANVIFIYYIYLILEIRLL